MLWALESRWIRGAMAVCVHGGLYITAPAGGA